MAKKNLYHKFPIPEFSPQYDEIAFIKECVIINHKNDQLKRAYMSKINAAANLVAEVFGDGSSQYWKVRQIPLQKPPNLEEYIKKVRASFSSWQSRQRAKKAINILEVLGYVKGVDFSAGSPISALNELAKQDAQGNWYRTKPKGDNNG